MADVTGPISTMPGFSGYKLPEGTMCDDHPDVPATVRVQGETDSMGSEMNDMCDECYKVYREEVKAGRKEEAECEWCKKMATGLQNRRDYNEGMNGRVYRVCKPCRDRVDEKAEQYLEESGFYDSDHLTD